MRRPPLSAWHTGARLAPGLLHERGEAKHVDAASVQRCPAWTVAGAPRAPLLRCRRAKGRPGTIKSWTLFFLLGSALAVVFLFWGSDSILSRMSRNALMLLAIIVGTVFLVLKSRRRAPKNPKHS